MKITKIEIIPVNIPLIAPIRWAWGIRTGITRNIVKIYTSDGIVGLGETTGGKNIRMSITSMGEKLIGKDPENLNLFYTMNDLVPYLSSSIEYAAIAAIEMALLDICGKKHLLPLHSILGGKIRDKVQFSSYVFYRYKNKEYGGENSPSEILSYCKKEYEEHGFEVFKLKAGVFEPKKEIETIELIRKEMKFAKLRIDPNGVWSIPTSINVAKQIGHNLEYYEDPSFGLGAMKKIKKDVIVPLATNMSVVSFQEIPLSIHLGCVDIILGDVHKWGGIFAVKRLFEICEIFNLGFSMHSGCELGISTMVNVHIGSVVKSLFYAYDTVYTHQSDDIIVGGKLKFLNGCLVVPDKPGIGVDLDKDKIKIYNELFKKEGDYTAVGDVYQPNWIPQKIKW